MADDPLGPLIAHLHGNGRLRVWSIVITIFGDAIVPRGGRVPLADLLAIADRLVIEANALRTAMARLASDGWVEREKQGRTSTYFLSQSGARTFVPATDRIYTDAFPEEVGEASIALHSQLEANAMMSDAALALRPGLSLVFGAVPDDKTTLFAPISPPLPDWLGEEVAAKIGVEDYRELAALLSADHHLTEPLDALCLRVLLIHFWRRLVLRHAPIPVAFLPTGWPGQVAQAKVKALYRENLALSEEWWSSPTPDAGRALLEARFGP